MELLFNKITVIPKVLLITGDKGLGKFTMAFHLINYVLSSNTKNSYDLANLAINKDNLFYKTALSNVNENIIIVSNYLLRITIYTSR